MYDFGIQQAKAGYRVSYRHGETNHCPGCGKSHWTIGRTMAECAYCCTALPITERTVQGVIRERRKREASFRVEIPTTVTPIGKRRVSR